MKIKLGPAPYIYPMPTVIVGSVFQKKTNFTTISYIGIVQHNPPMLSIAAAANHQLNKGIKESKTFSINIPNTKMLRVTDYIGMKSGADTDKSKLFDTFFGELENAPMIMEAPLNLECKLVEIIDLKNENELFIGEIIQCYSEKKYIRKGNPFIRKLDPILFSINSNSYFKVGRRIGYAWKAGLKFKPKTKRMNKTG